MVDHLIHIDWKESLFKAKAGWIIPSGNTTQTLFFPKKKLSQVPRNLRDSEVIDRFEELVSSNNDFIKWWNQICGGEGDKIFLLRFPNGVWDIPWELLIKQLKLTNKEATACLARTAGESTPYAPSFFSEPLQILILMGAFNGLDINREVQLIQSAWEGLELNVRECIKEPIAEYVTKENVTILLKKHKPHIIWFSGHGRLQSDVQLLFANETWVSASEFANLIQESGQRPLYAVFWACDTGRVDNKCEAVSYPPALFVKLRNIGVISVLTMQSPISDSSVLPMAQNFFRYLAMGLPLEKAIARARSHLIVNPPDDAHSLDWASPVVWSAGVPADRLHWNKDVTPLAQFQVLGWKTICLDLERPSQLDAPVNNSEKSRASEWIKQPLTWINGNINEAEHKYHWLRTLQAIQIQKQLFVIAVEMDSRYPEESLQKWADSVYRQMLPGDFPWEVARILYEVKKIPLKGWSKLCSLDGIYLAIANPPLYSDNWFWKPLLSEENNMLVAILSDQDLTQDIQASWVIDGIGESINRETIEATISKAPRLVRALAMLNIPLRSSYLTVQAKEEEGACSFKEWQEWNNIMRDTSAGPIMYATARQYVNSKIESDKLRKETQLDCVKILGHPGLSLTPAIREHRLEHLLGAELNHDALIEAASLCYIFRSEDRPFEVLRIVELLGALKTNLPMEVRLIVAWANLQFGRVQEAKYWLMCSYPSDTLDIAWKHALQAEMYKSGGTEHSKENALKEIEEAIRVCEDGQKNSNKKSLIQNKIRAYRQDRARIKHFLFYNLEEAADEYEKLIQEWRNLPFPVIDVAIVKRNYAECLHSLATEQDDPQWQKANELLQDAEDIARSYPHAPVLSEILYEKAKAAEREKHTKDVIANLKESIEEAKKSRHYMMLAIAENRLFWNSETFSMKRWNEIELDLQVFPHHGWAVRTLIDSRLRVSKILEEKNDFLRSYAQLEANLDCIIHNPSFNKGSDRFRIAATMAGLQLIGEKIEKPGFYWQKFLSQYSWAQEWLQNHSIHCAEDIWLEVK